MSEGGESLNWRKCVRRVMNVLEKNILCLMEVFLEGQTCEGYKPCGGSDRETDTDASDSRQEVRL